MTQSHTIRVGLVEGHTLRRDAFRSLLEASGTIVVVGEASGPDVLEMLNRERPDVVLLMMDGSSERELALLSHMRDIAEVCHALVIASEGDTALYAQAVELGARGVVTQDQSAQMLVKAVHKVRAGEIWLDRARTAGVVIRLTHRSAEQDPETAQIDSLTPRERQIVELVTEGLTNKDIAARLFISEATVRNHLTSILDKLNLSDRFQLTVYAFRRGLVLCPQTPAMLRMAAAMTTCSTRLRDDVSERASRGRKA